MRIILVHKFFYLTGGADVFFQNTGKILADNNNEVAFFSTLSDKNIQSEYSGYFIKPPAFSSSNPFKKFSSIFKICYSFEAKNKFENLVKEFKPDIVHLFGFFSHISVSILSVTKAYNIPVILSCNDYKHICPNYKLFYNDSVCEDCLGEKFYHAFKNKCANNSSLYSAASMIEAYFNMLSDSIPNKIDKFLFASEFMREKTKQFWKNYNISSEILRNPFETKKAINVGNFGEYILFLGRFVEEKGLDVLVNAMKYIPQIKLKIIGDGPQKSTLLNLIKDLNISNVEFCGELWGDRLNELIENCRFMVVPSKWHENYPYVILQAFEHTKPVIGSNRGGIPELLDNERNGVLFDIESSKNLADKISSLYYDIESCKIKGLNAYNYLKKNFSDEIFYENLVKIYRELVP